MIFPQKSQFGLKMKILNWILRKFHGIQPSLKSLKTGLPRFYATRNVFVHQTSDRDIQNRKYEPLLLRSFYKLFLRWGEFLNWRQLFTSLGQSKFITFQYSQSVSAVLRIDGVIYCGVTIKRVETVYLRRFRVSIYNRLIATTFRL